MINAPTLIKFWDHVILTAFYLINHIPSSALDNEIPIPSLFSKDLLYMFDFTCFGHLCILRYSKTQKRFWCCYTSSPHFLYLIISYFIWRYIILCFTSLVVLWKMLLLKWYILIYLRYLYLLKILNSYKVTMSEFCDYGIIYERQSVKTP